MAGQRYRLTAATSRMARITMVHDIAGVAEVEARLLREAGHEVTMVRLSSLGAGWSWPWKILGLGLRLLSFLPIVARLRQQPPEILHIHWVPMGVIGVLSGRPFFLSAHGSDLHQHFRNPVLRAVSHAILRRARCVFYSTPNLAAFLASIEVPCVELPNPVDVDAYPARRPHPGHEVLLFTRLDPIKGVEAILPAAVEISGTARVTGLAWGPLKADYMRRYADAVSFVDPVPHEAIPAFLAGFDAIVGQMNQGILSLAEIEALAAGFPVVTGIDWALYGADPPPVIEAHDSASIAAAVRALLTRGPGASDGSREARDWVRRNHGFEKHLAVLEREYGISR